MLAFGSRLEHHINIVQSFPDILKSIPPEWEIPVIGDAQKTVYDFFFVHPFWYFNKVSTQKHTKEISFLKMSRSNECKIKH